MLKKFLLFAAFLSPLLVVSDHARAQVDANYADQAALDGVKGIGPVLSSAILGERRRHGNFRDWPDLLGRVSGIGDRRAVALSEAGLLVNGRGMPAPYSKPTPSPLKAKGNPGSNTNAASTIRH